jgi:hypothetical protein
MHLAQLHAVEPGATLARSVRDANGTILCAAGVRLTQDVIRSLRENEVTKVVLVGGGLGAEQFQARAEKVRQRFENVTDPLLLRYRDRALALLAAWTEETPPGDGDPGD